MPVIRLNPPPWPWKPSRTNSRRKDGTDKGLLGTYSNSRISACQVASISPLVLDTVSVETRWETAASALGTSTAARQIAEIMHCDILIHILALIVLIKSRSYAAVLGTAAIRLRDQSTVSPHRRFNSLTQVRGFGPCTMRPKNPSFSAALSRFWRMSSLVIRV